MSQPSLHHIGYVVPSIAAVGARFAKSVAATGMSGLFRPAAESFGLVSHTGRSVDCSNRAG
jgi:hypothetical protein